MRSRQPTRTVSIALDFGHLVLIAKAGWRSVSRIVSKVQLAGDYLTLRTADGMVFDVYTERATGASWLQRVMD